MQDKLWRNRGHVQNDRLGQPIFMHRTDAKLEVGKRQLIPYITSPVGPATYDRDFIKVDGIKALREDHGRQELECSEMDQLTVQLIQGINPDWCAPCMLNAPPATRNHCVN